MIAKKERNVMNYGDFKTTDATRFDLPIDKFQGGPWMHLATITRSLSEYVVLMHKPTQEIYIEQISATGHFHKIEDEALWKDLVYYATSKGYTAEVSGKEIVVARQAN